MHSAFHSKASSLKGIEAVTTNITTNKLIPNGKGTLRTEKSITSTSSDNLTTVTLKHNAKLKMVHIGNMLDPKISFLEPSKDRMDIWAKRFCLKTIHTGVNKLVSNYASIEFYNSVMEGVHEYHTTVLSGVEINKFKIAPPPKVKLNKDNISIAQSALLEAYQSSHEEGNPYNDIKGYYGKYYSIMHDGIQNFNKELNRIFVRTLSTCVSSTKISNIPWSLKEIPGGSLNAQKLIAHFNQLDHRI